MFKILSISLLSIGLANASEPQNINLTKPIIELEVDNSENTPLLKINDLNIDNNENFNEVPQNDLNTTIESQINSGEICQKNEIGVIICNSIDNIVEEPEPALATGTLSWEEIFPIIPEIPMDLKFCLKKKEHVLANFENSVNNKNINGIIDTINWKGKSVNYSYAKIEDLEKNIGEGYWEKSNVINWNGPVEKIKEYPIYVRWVNKNNENEYYFTMINIDTCWFLDIQEKPNDLVEIEGVFSEGRIIPHNLIIETENEETNNNIDYNFF